MKIGRKAIEEDGECLFCDRAWAVIGIVGGAFILFTSVDLLLNGALTGGFRAQLSNGDEAEEIDDTEPIDAEVIEDVRGDDGDE